MSAKPTAGEQRFWVVIGGIVIPLACFGIAAVIDPDFSLAPEWQRDQWRDYAGLLFLPSVFVGLALLIVIAAAATAFTVRDARCAANTHWRLSLSRAYLRNGDEE